ncbi:hypothetical protein [Streptomyces sp. NPDC088261]|uniref:hypothetical protein n=1 Tax=Streptomyces sp. NPDC088261 TaxID=3365851 RepID=UPI00380899D0
MNHVPAEPGGTGGAADLSVDQDKLGAIGGAANDLYARLRTDGDTARASTAEAASGLTVSGFRTGSAVGTVHDTWNAQVKTLLDACAHISNHLDYSVAQHAKDDAEIGTSLAVSVISDYFE